MGGTKKTNVDRLFSSEDSDSEDDKNEPKEDGDGIPSFDDEEPRSPQRKPSKFLKKKRLSNEKVKKLRI